MNDEQSIEGAAAALSALQPAVPSAQLLARLRAARPADRTKQPPQLPPTATPLPPHRTSLGAAAALALVMAALAGSLVFRSRAKLGDHATGPLTADHPARSSPDPARNGLDAPVAAVAPAGSRPVFLPVETNRTLLAVHPVSFVQQPDEAPHHLMRALVQEDLTAVGAEIDATLHLRRTREIFIPVRSPVY